MKKYVLLGVSFFLLSSSVLAADVQGVKEADKPIKIDNQIMKDWVDSTPQKTEELMPKKVSKSHWSGLPFFGDEARKKGYDIEPPFVFAYHYEHQSQYVRPKQGSLQYTNIETDISKNVLGIPGLIGIDTLADGRPNIYIETGKAKERTTTNGLRAGVWVFPFMQVYGIYNRVEGKSQVDTKSYTKLSGPFVSILNQNLINSFMPGAIYHGNGLVETNDRIEISLDSRNYGGGLTFAGGYKQYFAILDMNYTYTKFDFSRDYVHTFVLSPRVGYDTKLFDRPLRIWTGIMGQYVSSKVTGRLTALQFSGSTGSMVPLINPNGTAGFKVEQHLVRPINYMVGFRYTITPHAAFMLEGGYAGPNGRKSILGNVEILF